MTTIIWHSLYDGTKCSLGIKILKAKQPQYGLISAFKLEKINGNVLSLGLCNLYYMRRFSTATCNNISIVCEGEIVLICITICLIKFLKHRYIQRMTPYYPCLIL